MSELQTFWEELKSGRFASMVKESCKGQALNNSHEVYNIMKPLFAENDDIETIYCIFLNSKNYIISIEKMFSGSITSASIYPREIVKRVLALKSTALILVHNHPSGDTIPSPEDKAITIKVGVATASIDACLHDHIIVGNGFHSMTDTGWLRGIKAQFTDLLNSG